MLGLVDLWFSLALLGKALAQIVFFIGSSDYSVIDLLACQLNQQQQQ